MNIDVDGLLDRTVTVFNKIGAKESSAQEDKYRPTVLKPALWSENVTRTQDADGTVHLKRSVRVQVPSGTAVFMERGEWLAKAVKSPTEGVYTLTLHDYMMLGEVAAKGDMTRQEMLREIGENPHCEVMAVRDLRNNDAVSTQEVGCLKYASVVYAEGM